MNRAEAIEAAGKLIADALRLAYPAESEPYGSVLVCWPDSVLEANVALVDALALPADSDTCKWTHDEYVASVWNTECGHSVTKRDYWSVFCQFCGKRIEVKEDGAE